MQAFVEREQAALEGLFEQCSCGSWAAAAGDEEDAQDEAARRDAAEEADAEEALADDGPSPREDGAGDRVPESKAGRSLSSRGQSARRCAPGSEDPSQEPQDPRGSTQARREGAGDCPPRRAIDLDLADHSVFQTEGKSNSRRRRRRPGTGGGEPRASFTGTYAHLLAYSLPRTLTKQLVRDAFGANEDLGFLDWCQALGTIASHLYAASRSEVASLQSLIRMVKFANRLCRSAEDFVHALSCVGVLNISFCYWDAYRLHRSYASRGFRGLLQALRSADALEKSFNDDIFEFAQRLLYTDKGKKRRLSLDTLQAVEAQSATLIELYPDLGLGCTFVDFVDRWIAENIVPELRRARSIESRAGGGLPRGSSRPTSRPLTPQTPPTSSHHSKLPKVTPSPLRRAFLQGPDARAWLDRTGVSLSHEDTSLAWAAAEGDFDVFIAHVCLQLDALARAQSKHQRQQPLQQAPPAPPTSQLWSASSTPPRQIDRASAQIADSDLRASSPLLAQLFEAGRPRGDGGEPRRTTWSRPTFYGFMMRFAAPPIPVERLLLALRAQGPRLDARGFCEAIKFFARDGVDLELPVNVEGADDLAEAIPFAWLEFDLDSALRIHCLGDTELQERLAGAEAGGTETDRFRAFVAASLDAAQPFRVARLTRCFAPLESAACWFGLLMAFTWPYRSANTSVTSVSSIAFMYERFSPQGATAAELGDLLMLYLATVPDLDEDAQRRLLTGHDLPTDFTDGGAGDARRHAEIRARVEEDFAHVAAVPADALEALENQLEPAPTVAAVGAADPEVLAVYERMASRAGLALFTSETISSTGKGEGGCVVGLLVCASALIAKRRGVSLPEVVGGLGAIGSEIFDFQFRPAVVAIFQARRHTRRFDMNARDGALSRRGFLAILNQANLGLGVAQRPESRALVKTLRGQGALERMYATTAPTGRMALAQFEEALAGIALHAAALSDGDPVRLLDMLVAALL